MSNRPREMKYQCEHNDTGLCKSCFEYEVKIAELKEKYESRTQGDCGETEGDRIFKQEQDLKDKEIAKLQAQVKEGKDE